jgi:hypothetical protein
VDEATARSTTLSTRGGDTKASALDDAAVDVRWPLLPLRTRTAGLLQHRLSEGRN